MLCIAAAPSTRTFHIMLMFITNKHKHIKKNVIREGATRARAFFKHKLIEAHEIIYTRKYDCIRPKISKSLII